MNHIIHIIINELVIIIIETIYRTYYRLLENRNYLLETYYRTELEPNSKITSELGYRI